MEQSMIKSVHNSGKQSPSSPAWYDRDIVSILAIAILVLLWFLAIAPAVARSEPLTVRTVAGNIAEKVTDTDWLSRKALKYGFIVSVCSTNTLRMHMEAERFNGESGCNDYHAKNLLLIIGYLTSGYLTYAVLDRDSWTWGDKCELIGGALSLSREFGEFAYQGGRHGYDNMFNNNPDWHRNELPWFSAKPTFPYLRDDFIATGRISTPAVHIGLTGLGMNLIGRVR
jgi:hypothetical protein